MCGKLLLVDEDTRYVAEILVYAAYDPLEITADDLRQDHMAQIRKLLADMETRDPRELEDEVAKCFRFNLCPDCQKEYIKDPLPPRPG